MCLKRDIFLIFAGIIRKVILSLLTQNSCEISDTKEYVILVYFNAIN